MNEVDSVSLAKMWRALRCLVRVCPRSIYYARAASRWSRARVSRARVGYENLERQLYRDTVQ